MKRKGKIINRSKLDDLRLLSKKLYNHLTKVKFKVRDKTYEVDIGSELLVKKEDIHGQVERISAVMGYFGSIVTILGEEYENKKALQRRIEAKIDKAVRDQGFTGEMRIDKRIKRSDKWIDACWEVNAAEANFNKARNLYFALRNKFEALNTRSADLRAVPSDSISGVTKENLIKLTRKKKAK